MFKSLSGWYDSICTPPFTEAEITNNIANAKIREVNKWDKHLAEKGKAGNNGHFLKYDHLLQQGYVLSRVSYGEREGELCLYNRKKDDTIFAENY